MTRYNPVSSGLTERHADGRLLRLAVRDLPEADGPDGGGAAVSRWRWSPNRLLPAQAFSESPGTGQHRLQELHFVDQNLGFGKVYHRHVSGFARRCLKPPASRMRLLGTSGQCGPSPWRTENWSRSGIFFLSAHRHRAPPCLKNRIRPVCYRTYATEVQKSALMNEALGRGIAVFQGLSNVVLNCEC